MRLKGLAAALFCLVAAAPLRAEWVVFRSGQRLAVTAYERRGEVYRFQVAGGFAEIAASEVLSIEPTEVFPPTPEIGNAGVPYREFIQQAAQRYGVDADLITSVISVESNFDPHAVSRRNARGLMQLLPETAERLGVKNIFDPRENIDGGTRYLLELLQRYGNDLVLALAAYNAGPDRVQHFGRVPPYRETQTYVRRVKRDYETKKAHRIAPQGRVHTPPKGKSASRGSLPL
jgi:soluble lytic murein transglycosylase-like protein